MLEHRTMRCERQAWIVVARKGVQMVLCEDVKIDQTPSKALQHADGPPLEGGKREAGKLRHFPHHADVAVENWILTEGDVQLDQGRELNW